MTSDAPAARATPTAKHPIGPQPSTKTRLPGTSASNTVWTAFPSGSMMAPTSVGIHPDDLGALTEMRGAESALETVAADDVALGGHRLSDGEQSGGLGFPAELDDLAGELMPDHDRRPEPITGPTVPFPDVKVGAADTRVVD